MSISMKKENENSSSKLNNLEPSALPFSNDLGT
jgi:hypothetical protein